MPTRLYLVRHGVTAFGHEDRYAGSSDVPLADEGRVQATQLASRLASTKLASIWCSPMSRTRETAAIIAKPHGIEPVVQDALREVDHGHWETMKRGDVVTAFPEEHAAWERDPLSFAPRGGETGLSVLARALPLILSHVEPATDGAVLIVSHKATIRLVTCALLGIDPRNYRRRLDLEPCALTAFDFEDASNAKLVLYNDVSHFG